MGLYLGVFKDDMEISGLEIGSYGDFGDFRDTVSTTLEGNEPGSKYPILILHSDCDGDWPVESLPMLIAELENISEAFRCLLPTEVTAVWKKEVVKKLGLKINTLYDCFFDIDGEPLLERLIKLARLGLKEQLPIIFQ